MAEAVKKFEDVLVGLKLITPDQVKEFKLESDQNGKSFEEVVRERGILDEESLVKAKAISSGLPYVSLMGQQIAPDVLNLIPSEVAKMYQVVPFGTRGNEVSVAMVNPDNVQAVTFIERKSGKHVAPYMASSLSVDYGIHLYASDLTEEMKKAVSGIETPVPEVGAEKKVIDREAIAGVIKDAPVTRAVNSILEFAVKQKASDIHIEPREKTVKVRFRIDGMLIDSMTLPKTIQAALVSRIKILSNLKIDEHRLPQDGRFKVIVEGREVDLRVSISPITSGEKVVIRILDQSAGKIDLENLGIRGRDLEAIQRALKKPHGMFLVTGPTGSGKSTTLYAALTKMNRVDVNIITLEDPVEYHIEGINQIQVNPDIGLTFASGLRSILRQDPDVIMVGEIRDAETAELAVQSALTGHVVLSTLHTNSAAGVLPRLLDMNVEPFLIASTVNTVLGQRLVRKICETCKEPYESSEAATEMIKEVLKGILPKDKAAMTAKAKELGYSTLPTLEQKSYTLYRGKGCADCNHSGYQGRMGIYEVFEVNPDMEHLLLSHATASEVQTQAIKGGMTTMRQDGTLKVLSGETTPEEVVRVAQD
jgi:type IV pilus assembly protein PilB